MSEKQHDQPATVSVRGSVIAFTITSIAGAVVMVGAMIWNHNGGF